MIAVADAIVHTQSVNLRHADGQPWAALRDGVAYGRYSAYGILPSLLALPASAISAVFAPRGSAAASDLTRLLASFINAPITAATIACIAVLLNRSTLSRRARVTTLCAAALGSCLWPYARSFFSEPLTALLITASLTAATATPRTRASILCAALCAGLLLPTRIAAVVALPILAAAALWAAPFRWRTLVGYAVGLLPGVALWAAYNSARFGTPLASGYGTEASAFSTSLAVGLPGLLVSPGSGLVWYAPFVIAVPLGVRYWWGQQRTVVVATLALVASHLLLYGMWDAWDGGGVWGPRFLVPVIPAALVVAAGVWAAPQRWLHRTALFVVCAGIVINTLGAAVNFSIDSNLQATTPPPITHATILWQRIQTSVLTPGSCRIESGWHPSEAPDGVLWQRSAGASTLSCSHPSAAVVRFFFDDRRPEEAPRSAFVLDSGPDQYPIPNGTFRRVWLLTRAGTQTYTVRSTPWNAHTLGLGPRDGELGPTLLALSADPPLRTIHDASIAPMPSQPRRRWAWYYEPTNHHRGDWWASYLPATALAPWAPLIVAVWLCVVLGCLGAAWRSRQPT
ncbi:MAG: hypothetical protein RLZZ297_493 [Chloroflexota bacterium]|jgi:hypothetical protein